MKAHKWIVEDEEKLAKAVEECGPLLEHYTEQGCTVKSWWDSVAGRLLPDIKVTGAACARHFKRMMERKRDTEDAAWTAVACHVLDYERDLQESVYDMVVKICGMVEKLCLAWGVECSNEDDPVQVDQKRSGA